MPRTRRGPASAVAAFLVILLAVGSVPLLPAQTDPDEPVPYDPQEFPQWSRDLRRAEIVGLGAFPVAMILSSLGYQVGRYAYYAISSPSTSAEYAPGFLTPGTGPQFSSEERVGLIVSGAVISAGIALADYLLGRRERRTGGADRNPVVPGAQSRRDSSSPR